MTGSVCATLCTLHTGARKIYSASPLFRHELTPSCCLVTDGGGDVIVNFIIIFVTTRAVLEVVRGLSYKLWLTTLAGKRLWSRVLVKVRLTVMASSCTAATDHTRRPTNTIYWLNIFDRGGCTLDMVRSRVSPSLP